MSAPPPEKMDKVGQIGIFDAFFEKKGEMLNF